MKRTERHHLKENTLAVWVGNAWAAVNPRTVLTVAAVVVGLLAIVGAGFAWQQWRSTRASEALASAMVVLDAPVATGDTANAPGAYPTEAAKLEAAVPRLLDAADAYPSLAPGLTARFYAATALATLGRSAEAVEQYDRLAELDADGVYGRMASLGRAEAYLLQGDYAAAIDVLEAQAGASDSTVPVDAVLMRLGRVYQLADQPSEAEATFARVVDEFPTSSYRFDAERELETLGGR